MKGSFGKWIYSRSKTSLKYCFLDSALNSMSGVLCSAMVREWLRMRKSLVMYYWQDAISRVEVTNNVININKL